MVDNFLFRKLLEVSTGDPSQDQQMLAKREKMGDASDQYLQKVIDKINSGMFPPTKSLSNTNNTQSGEI